MSGAEWSRKLIETEAHNYWWQTASFWKTWDSHILPLVEGCPINKLKNKLYMKRPNTGPKNIHQAEYFGSHMSSHGSIRRMLQRLQWNFPVTPTKANRKKCSRPGVPVHILYDVYDVLQVFLVYGMHRTVDRNPPLPYRHGVATVCFTTRSFYSIEQIVCDSKTCY